MAPPNYKKVCFLLHGVLFLRKENKYWDRPSEGSVLGMSHHLQAQPLHGPDRSHTYIWLIVMIDTY